MDNTTPHKASEYDINIRKVIPYYDHFYAETLDVIMAVQPEVKIWLDTGCGTGALIEQAYRYFPHTYFILSDPSPDMLAQAQRKLVSIPRKQLRFLPPTSTEQLHIDEVSAPQVITAIQAHHYLSTEARQTATLKCFELLESRGIYVTFENIHPDSAHGITIGLARWKVYQCSHGRDNAIVDKHLARFNTAYFPLRIDEHLDLLTSCGFAVVELFWYSYLQAGFYAIKA